MKLFIRLRLSLVGGALILCTVLALLAFIPVGEQQLLFRDHAVLIPLFVLAMVIPVLLLSAFASPTNLDQTFPLTPALTYRSLWAIGWFLLLMTLTVIIGGLRVGGEDLLMLARNLTFGYGLMLLSAAAMPVALSWLPLTGYGLLSWFLGVSDVTGEALWWALPHHHAWNYPVAAISLGVFLTGMGLYVVKGPRPISL